MRSPIFQVRATFFLVFVLMFGALGSFEGSTTLELIYGDDRAHAMEATPAFWLCVSGFAVAASLILLFVIRKDLE
jgi:hypothetical protein